MAATQEQKPPFWQQTWFVESNWISASTKWILTFGGKAARIVLIICTLYMSAELYPGVSLPPGLNLAVFIVLSFALDMGGMGLAQIAKTARDQGNTEGAEQGEKLARWLITIMIAGLVTVSLEHAVAMIDFFKPWKNDIAAFWILVEIALSIARVICAVNYGHVVHALERSVEDAQTQEQNHLEELQAQVFSFQQKVSTLTSQLDTANGQVDTLSGQVQAKEQEVDTLRFQVDSEQMKVSTLRGQLEDETQGSQGRVDSLRQRLEQSEQEMSTLRTHLSTAQNEASRWQLQLTERGQEVSTLQQHVSTLTNRLDAAKKEVDTLRGQVDRKKVSTVDTQVDSGRQTGHPQVDSRVIQLDAKREQMDSEKLDEQIKQLLMNEPGLSDRKIADRLGCSPTTVGKRRKAIEQVS